MLGAATQAFETTLDYLKTACSSASDRRLPGAAASAAKMFTDLATGALLRRGASPPSTTARPTPPAGLAGQAKMATPAPVPRMVQMHGGIGMTDAHDAGLY